MRRKTFASLLGTSLPGFVRVTHVLKNVLIERLISKADKGGFFSEKKIIIIEEIPPQEKKLMRFFLHYTSRGRGCSAAISLGGNLTETVVSLLLSKAIY